MLNRRQMIEGAGVALLVAGCSKGSSDGGDAEVTANEDLMREHGLLRRVMIAYDEASGRLRDVSPDLIVDAAAIVRTFVEDYHEKLEEIFIFPRLMTAGVHQPLVATLRAQHQVGRQLTDAIRTLAQTKPLDDRRLLDQIRAFNRMYRAHAAHEDTVVFPAFKKLLTAHEYDDLGDKFEDRERQMFGADGFEANLAKVAAIEHALGIADLTAFTPRVPGA
jgi:hemerythrin-like domain-containing protein